MRFILAILLLSICSISLSAKEGMWIPYLLEKVNHSDMVTMGLELSAEDIYSVNNSSLKDAIVHFNGGCTASLISKKGLLLTNHHCGYSLIQKHSSVKNNYLEDGYWASTPADELKNPGVTATLIKYMKDVTNLIMAGIESKMSEAVRDSIVQVNIKNVIAKQTADSDYNFQIKPFFHGNQYIMIARETFKDVRLVGAPPSSIGKFGADTDNWMWPRHTGDFSLFRIYANKDNKPADPADDNVPYQPLYNLRIDLTGFQDGDFTMVYGFPGTTKEYLPASEVRNIVEEYNPQRIAIRTQILDVLSEKMRQDEATNIKYASKYAGVSNSWKRWKGEIKGLKETGALEKIEQMEETFLEMLKRRPGWVEKYGNIINAMDDLMELRKPIMKERYSYIEIGYFGLEYMRHLLRYRQFVEGMNNDSLPQERREFLVKRYQKSTRNFLKDYDPALGEQVAQALLPDYLNSISLTPIPEAIVELRNEKKLSKAIGKMYAKNRILKDTAKWFALMRNKPVKAAQKLADDRAYQLAQAMYKHYAEVLRPAYNRFENKLKPLQRKYMIAQQLVFPKIQFYPNANSTLRLSYGQVKPYKPRDGVTYNTQTYLQGVIEKYIPGDYEFDLPQKLIDLHNQKDYGQYGENGKMPVCFIATNHTTGGNSGSPAFDGQGHLIGLNFDRAWEGTMSDMYFDKSICRNIMVDIRYVLFIIDKYAGANRLIEELDLITAQAKKVKNSLPEASPQSLTAPEE